MAEQDLPATTYDMEWVFALELFFKNIAAAAGTECQSNLPRITTRWAWDVVSTDRLYWRCFNVLCYQLEHSQKKNLWIGFTVYHLQMHIMQRMWYDQDKKNTVTFN